MARSTIQSHSRMTEAKAALESRAARQAEGEPCMRNLVAANSKDRGPSRGSLPRMKPRCAPCAVWEATPCKEESKAREMILLSVLDRLRGLQSCGRRQTWMASSANWPLGGKTMKEWLKSTGGDAPSSRCLYAAYNRRRPGRGSAPVGSRRSQPE